MSVRKNQIYPNMVYFCTVTCFQWIPLFEITKLYNHIYEWFDYLNRKGIKIIGFVLMPNHFHIILFLPEDKFNIHKIIGNCKRFMAYEIVERLSKAKEIGILKSLQESVNESGRLKGKNHNVYEPSFDCKPIVSEKFIVQKLNYIHANPVRGKWNLVNDYRYFEHSSAGFYETNKYKGYKVTHYSDL